MKLTAEFKVWQVKFITAGYLELYEGLIKYFREQCSINGPKMDEVMGGRRKLTTRNCYIILTHQVLLG
jgi:hypothetical protein